MAVKLYRKWNSSDEMQVPQPGARLGALVVPFRGASRFGTIVGLGLSAASAQDRQFAQIQFAQIQFA